MNPPSGLTSYGKHGFYEPSTGGCFGSEDDLIEFCKQKKGELDLALKDKNIIICILPEKKEEEEEEKKQIAEEKLEEKLEEIEEELEKLYEKLEEHLEEEEEERDNEIAKNG